ncbi:hypothetical protein DC498_13090 [Terrimonas sp.]|uniref:hypothetical protein n=1 Tax=Terrimonas sp. TaxID=1914338 RepID=UPI000D510859|nr:hypothetical protein [Terrimonas sp.]PVD51658.1 hypothetical protein DC498_13090 [Terrimonas sp.]
MKKTIIYFTVLFSLLTTAALSQTKTTTKPAAKPAATAKGDALTNKSIIDLHKAGLGDEIILTKIAQSKCAFDLSTDGLIDLKSKGVSADVIKAMMNKSESGTGNSAINTATIKEPVKSNSSGKTGSPSPELMNHVYVYDKSNQSAKPLEKSVAGIRTKQGMFGGSAMLQVDGAKSAVQIAPAETISFVINTGGATLPELTLYKLKSVKNKREVASMKVNSFSGVKTGEDVISLNISKLSEGIFEVTPAKKLEKGEYFFTGKPAAGANSMDAYTFGIE